MARMAIAIGSYEEGRGKLGSDLGGPGVRGGRVSSCPNHNEVRAPLPVNSTGGRTGGYGQ